VSRKRIFLAAPLALGLGVLIWALGRAHEQRPARAAARPGSPASVAEPAGGRSATLVAEPLAASRPSPAPTAAESAAIGTRVAELEASLRALETRRDELAESNRELERRAAERGAEAGALAQAEWRVRAWEKLLGFPAGQRAEVLELAKAWAREDAGRKAGRETWAAREDGLRARLTSEQASALNRHVAESAARMWSQSGQALGGFAGLSAEERARVQSSLGDFRLPASALLPEAHGADWTAMIREAAARAAPLLTPEQSERMGRSLPRY